jgi:hypothetical protein
MANCHCGEKANTSWTLNLCADNRRKRVLRLCQACDNALNDQVLMLLGDKKRVQKMDRYRKLQSQ